MLQIKRWLMPPIFLENEIKTRQAHLLNSALITTTVLASIILIGNLLGGRTPLAIMGADIAAIVMCVILWRWMHQGRIHLASVVLIGMDLIGTTAFVALLGTIRTPTTAIYLLIVIAGGLLFDMKGILFTSAVSSLAVLGLVTAENAGLLPPPDYAVTLTQWIAYSALFALSGALTLAALDATRQALKRADAELVARQRTDKQLRRYNRELEMLNHTSGVLTATLDLDEVFLHLLEEAGILFNAVGSFWLLDSERGELVCRQASGPSSDLVRGWRLPIGEGIAGRVAQDGQGLIIQDAAADQRHYRGVEERTGLVAHSMLCVPLKAKQGLLGVLQLMDTVPNRFEASDMTLAEFFAATATIAIENAQLYETAQREIAERKRAELALQAERDFAFRVMNTMGQGLTVSNREGRLEFVNPAFTRMIGFVPDELAGKSPSEFTSPLDQNALEQARVDRVGGKTTSYETRLVHKNGNLVPVLITGSPRSSKGNYTGTITVITDLTDLKRIEDQLRYLSTHDTLTGVYNRAFFETELVRLENSREFPISIAVADLDHMKFTNDTLGHSAGDELLKQAARVLESVFRGSDILARIGGDEFALILPNTNQPIAEEIVGRVKNKLAAYDAAHSNLPIGLSIGISTAAESKLEEAFKRADAQMYEDKRGHKSRSD